MCFATTAIAMVVICCRKYVQQSAASDVENGNGRVTAMTGVKLETQELQSSKERVEGSEKFRLLIISSARGFLIYLGSSYLIFAARYPQPAILIIRKYDICTRCGIACN